MTRALRHTERFADEGHTHDLSLKMTLLVSTACGEEGGGQRKRDKT
jgi:hypothetical protein